MQKQGLPRHTLSEPGGGRENSRDADEKQKSREDEVCRGKPAPGSMLEWPIGSGFVAVIIDEDHKGDRKTA